MALGVLSGGVERFLVRSCIDFGGGILIFVFTAFRVDIVCFGRCRRHVAWRTDRWNDRELAVMRNDTFLFEASPCIAASASFLLLSSVVKRDSGRSGGREVRRCASSYEHVGHVCEPSGHDVNWPLIIVGVSFVGGRLGERRN